MGSEPMPPHNLTYTVLGAAMLWVGWFGFNAGSELASDGLAASAFCVTHFAAAAGSAGLGRHGMDHARQAERAGRRSGAGGRAGLHHAGLGLRAADAGHWRWAWPPGIVCFLACTKLKSTFGYDDSLDAFGVHGVGGTLGAILTGVFATSTCAIRRWSATASRSGLIEGGPSCSSASSSPSSSPGSWPPSSRSSSSRCST